jgi:hypothetical protein
VKNPLQARKCVMGYSTNQADMPGAPRRDFCASCKHVRAQGADLRCVKGSFFVRPSGTCKEFEAGAKVAIGPTDV